MANDIEFTTSIELPEGSGMRDSPLALPFLVIRTGGGSGMVSTTASVQFITPASPGRLGSSQYRMFHDFSSTIIKERKRAAKKALETQHAGVLANLDHIRAAAVEHYQAKLSAVA